MGLLFGVAGYAMVGVFAYLFADVLIFRPSPSTYEDTPELSKVQVAPGISISALYLPAPGAELAILYSHGNGDDLGRVRPLLEEFRAHGFSALAYDYEGYGTSDGKPSERAAYRDVEAAFRHLVEERGIPPGRILAYGFSVGGGPAAELASRHEIGGLVLDSTFVSAFRVMTRVPLFPFDEFDVLSRLRAARCPILVMHSRDDPVIAFWHGRALFEASPEPKRSRWFEHAGHGGAPWVDPDGYWQALAGLAELARQRTLR